MEVLGHDYFMGQALQLAGQALDEGEIPVGAVVASGGKILGKGYNQTERLNDVTAHAEMLALTAAFQSVGGKYLPDCVLYVTLEPCVMCAGAMYWAQLGGLVYGAEDAKRGFRRKGQLLHPKTVITTGVRASESQALLHRFFKNLRT